VGGLPILHVLSYRLMGQPSSSVFSYLRRFSPYYPDFDIPPNSTRRLLAKSSKEIDIDPLFYVANFFSFQVGLLYIYQHPYATLKRNNIHTIYVTLNLVRY
jgi:hypothetical protein